MQFANTSRGSARSASRGSGLFGSLARGDAGPGSNVDVLIAIPKGRKFSLFDLGEVQVELCELLGRAVDVDIEEDLVPNFRSDIAPDLVAVF